MLRCSQSHQKSRILFLSPEGWVAGMRHHTPFPSILFGLGTGSHEASERGLELITYLKLTSDYPWPSCLSLVSAEIIGLFHRAQFPLDFLQQANDAIWFNLSTDGFHVVKNVKVSIASKL